MAQLMVHRNILKGFGKLPVKVQKRMAEFIDRFQNDPTDPALNVHPLKESMIDPKVRGASLPDEYRAIIVAPEKGDTYMMVHVDTHDEAYDWARNKRFEVHEMTGVFQLFDVQEVEAAVVDTVKNAESQEGDYPLGLLSDEDLFAVGVPRPLIPAVRAVRTDAALEALTDYLPPDCRDVLHGLAAGMSIEEALDEMLGLKEREGKPDGPGDFTNVAKTPNFDLVLVEGEDHFKDILAASLDEWRIFLHPYQRKLVEWNVNGPLNINGAAGTGKTVVLMHRAVHLARNLNDSKARVLVTTFTTNLSITIKGLIRKLGPDVAERIEITNLHALARTICSRAGWRGRIASDEELEAVWNETWLDSSLGELPMTQEELKKEFYLVVDPGGIDSEDDYLTVVRTGRPRLGREQRRAAWNAFQSFRRGLKKRNLLTFEGAVHEARLVVEQGNFQKYANVLVDETQDFSLEALRLVRALSPVGEGTVNPLCIVGDGHQRIYRAKIPLNRAGIDIRGRSRRLKINYRTSEQIRRFAQGILQGIEVDDLDGGTVSVVGDHSVFKGPDPIVEYCTGVKSESEAILAWVQTVLESGLSSHAICITPYKPEIREVLSAAGIATYELKPKEDDPVDSISGVRMGSMKRIKGLEFRAVALACADLSDPLNNLAEADLLSKCERYVAASRAREHLFITLGQLGGG